MTSRRTFILALAAGVVSGTAIAAQSSLVTVYLNPT